MNMTGAQLRALATELRIALAFATRLPLAPARPADGAAVARAAWALPLAGAFVGLCGGLVLLLAHALRLPPLPSATLAVAATMLLTGALHEDGLADTADGFGGGREPEHKLAIMRDSRIGTYGACAIGLSLLLRAAALAAVPTTGGGIAALIAAHAAARAMMPACMWLVPPARPDGLAAGAGTPPAGSVVAALVLGALATFAALGVGGGAVGLLLLALLLAGGARLCLAQVGGQTGDVLGALEQAGEIVILLCAAAA